MKKISVLVLSLFTLPLHAQGILGSLNQHQSALENPGQTKPGSSVVKTPTVSTSTTGRRCEENDQTSLPLAYVTSLIQERNGTLDVNFDARTGSLTVSAPDMISNCSSMLEWKMKTGEIAGKKSYSVEVKFKEGSDCSAAGCKYKVAKVEKGEFKEHDEMTFKPTLKGFEQCLQKSGVIKDGKVVKGAIYSAPLVEKFQGVEESGKLLFVSHGPSSAQVKVKYGNFELIEKCDHYEAIHPQLKQLLTLEDEEKQRLDEEASKLRSCPINEYHKVSDFIEKYEDYASQLGEVRDRLILEAAKKAALAIEKGNYTDEDLKVLIDFEKYIVMPKVEMAKAIYEEMVDLEGDARKAKEAELKNVLAQINALNKKPYFLVGHTKKLLADAKFEDAEKLNAIKITLDNFKSLGQKQQGEVITPDVAMSRIAKMRAGFAADLVIEIEKHEVRTGQTTGQADYYSGLTSRMRKNIQTRTENFKNEIQIEYARVQPGGYCYAYFRNTQKCIQDSLDRIQELQNYLKHYNSIDDERAKEYEAKASEYAKLEAEGRRYIAAQNGEELPPEAPAPKAEDTTVPRARPESNGQNGVYTFNYPGSQQGQMPQQQMMPQNMFQQPQNPYGQWAQYGQYQQPHMGQQAYGYSGMNGSYNFNWNGGGQQQMYGGQGQQPWGQPQQGYWGQPYQAYNMYSMYGR